MYVSFLAIVCILPTYLRMDFCEKRLAVSEILAGQWTWSLGAVFFGSPNPHLTRTEVLLTFQSIRFSFWESFELEKVARNYHPRLPIPPHKTAELTCLLWKIRLPSPNPILRTVLGQHIGYIWPEIKSTRVSSNLIYILIKSVNVQFCIKAPMPAPSRVAHGQRNPYCLALLAGARG